MVILESFGFQREHLVLGDIERGRLCKRRRSCAWLRVDTIQIGRYLVTSLHRQRQRPIMLLKLYSQQSSLLRVYPSVYPIPPSWHSSTQGTDDLLASGAWYRTCPRKRCIPRRCGLVVPHSW